MRAGLIDEYRVFVHPVILGAGTPFFQARPGRADRAVAPRDATFGSGVVYLRYETVSPAG